MRLINQSIKVVSWADGQPVTFEYHGEHQVKAILDYWLESGQWWAEETEKSFFRVVTTQEGIFELCFCHQDAAWILTKVFD